MGKLSNLITGMSIGLRENDIGFQIVSTMFNVVQSEMANESAYTLSWIVNKRSKMKVENKYKTR